jgi:hypothetical protein
LNYRAAWRCCISVTLVVSFSSIKESQAFVFPSNNIH